MTIVTNYKEYLRRRLEGDSVIDVVSAIAYQVRPETKNFSIFYLEEGNCIITEFAVSHDKLHVTDKNKIECGILQNYLREEYFIDDHTQRWWRMIFIERNGKINYDTYYDKYKISDLAESTDTFGDLISNLESEVEKWTSFFDDIPQTIYLFGTLARLPLRYLIEKKLKTTNVCLISNVLITDSQMLDILEPSIASTIRFKIDRDLHLDYLFRNDVEITIPISLLNLNQSAINNCKWEDLIPPSNIKSDYQINGIDFKILKISAEYDLYGNMFLVSSDLCNKKKVNLINTL